MLITPQEKNSTKLTISTKTTENHINVFQSLYTSKISKHNNPIESHR
jgi:hypothetical protein